MYVVSVQNTAHSQFWVCGALYRLTLLPVIGVKWLGKVRDVWSESGCCPVHSQPFYLLFVAQELLNKYIYLLQVYILCPSELLCSDVFRERPRSPPPKNFFLRPCPCLFSAGRYPPTWKQSTTAHFRSPQWGSGALLTSSIRCQKEHVTNSVGVKVIAKLVPRIIAGCLHRFSQKKTTTLAPLHRGVEAQNLLLSLVQIGWVLAEWYSRRHIIVRTITRGTAAAAPPPFRPGNPALCGSHPLVTPYYCRLEDLLCFVFIVSLLCFFC